MGKSLSLKVPGNSKNTKAKIKTPISAANLIYLWCSEKYSFEAVFIINPFYFPIFQFSFNGYKNIIYIVFSNYFKGFDLGFSAIKFFNIAIPLGCPRRQQKIIVQNSSLFGNVSYYMSLSEGGNNGDVRQGIFLNPFQD